MDSRRATAGSRVFAPALLTVSLLVLGCGGVLATAEPTSMPTVTPSERSPSATPPSPTASSSVAPSVTPWPTIDPNAAFGNALTCGDGTPSFPLELVNSRPDAEHGTEESSKALNAFLKDPVTNPDPASSAGWRRVVQTSQDALFISAVDPVARWTFVWLTSTGAGQGIEGWYFNTSGECRLEVDFGVGLRRAELTMEPGFRPAETDRSLPILVSELSCSSGSSPVGRIEEPKLAYEPTRVLVAVVIRSLPEPQDCQGVAPVPYTLQLAEAIGSRGLFDAARVPPVLVSAP